MDDDKMNQMADDVRLIATPFRDAREWLLVLCFILSIPVIIVVNIVYFVKTGHLWISDEEISMAKIALIYFSPGWIPLVGVLAWEFVKYCRNRQPKL